MPFQSFQPIQPDLRQLLEKAQFGTLQYAQTDDNDGYIWSDNQVANVAESVDPDHAAAFIAAVNAAPRLLAICSELSDCQPLPKIYKYTGTAKVDVADMFDVGHRHRNGKQPRDYLMSWLSMLRPFAYATQDDSWGEMEKLLSIVMNNYVQTLVKAEAARAALNTEAV